MRKILIKLSTSLLVFITFFSIAFLYEKNTLFAATNLIYNPGLEMQNAGGQPDGWIKGRWGTNTTVFSYPTTSGDGSNAATISISSYTSGDAKWTFTPVNVTPGKTYEYSDDYKSSVTTHITLEYTLNDGSIIYPDIAHPVASTIWKSETFRFIVPANVAKVRVYHLLNQNGGLSIDNVSLTDVTPPPPPPPSQNNLIMNPSFEFTNGNGDPTGWLKGRWGTNTTTFTFPISGLQGNGARVSVSAYTSGDAKWYFNNVNVSPGQMFEFSDFSKSTTKTFITVQFKKSDGTFSYLDLGTIGPSSNWTEFKQGFTVPAGVVSLTIFHLIKSVGTLDVDNYDLKITSIDESKFDKGYVSLNFDDGWLSAYQNALPILEDANFVSDQFIITGYMDGSAPGYITEAEVQDWKAKGHIIEAHTRTHPDLTTLSSSEASTEISGSRQDLLDINISPVNFFAYPFGAYNDQVIQLVKNAGFKAARSSDGGYNDKTINLYALRRQPMDNTTTFAQAKNYIDTAIANKTWVILLFHEINSSGNQFAITPALFQQIVDYIKSKNITPITVEQGVNLMTQ